MTFQCAFVYGIIALCVYMELLQCQLVIFALISLKSWSLRLSWVAQFCQTFGRLPCNPHLIKETTKTCKSQKYVIHSIRSVVARAEVTAPSFSGWGFVSKKLMNNFFDVLQKIGAKRILMFCEKKAFDWICWNDGNANLFFFIF